MIDNYIADQSPRITMTLSEIIANTPPVQTLAQATDVPGTNLEWMKTAAYPTGAWYGDLGDLGTTVSRDGLFTGYLALGVTCKVSGVPYSWGGAGVGWNYMGSGPQYVGTNIPLSGAYNKQRLQVDNPLVPGGRSEIWWTGTQWEVPPGELIVGLYGSLLDITASALSIGSWTEVWQSAIIPDYMILNCRSISISSEASLADAVSTATSNLRMRIATAAVATGDMNDALIGYSGASSSFGKGLSGTRVRGNIRTGTIWGNAGSTISTTGSQATRALGNVGAGATRIRLDLYPGALTNTLKLYSVELYAGA